MPSNTTDTNIKAKTVTINSLILISKNCLKNKTINITATNHRIGLTKNNLFIN